MSTNLDRRLIEVGYFLSRRGIDNPPIELNAKSWKEAYLKFYSAFGGDKTEDEFKNSLKNIRDHFDSYIENNRTGWMDNDNKPQKLSSINQNVFDELGKLKDDDLWKYIRPLAVLSYNKKLEDKSNSKVEQNRAKYFSSEFSGKKKVKGRTDIDANVIHGFVVDSLKDFVELSEKNATVYNTQKIDLAVEENGYLKKVFEVKTKSDSQSIYTAVGQLFMHSVLTSAEKIIVLPDDVNNKSLFDCLTELKITILVYSIQNDKCVFEKLALE